MLDHRGTDPFAPVIPLAQLGLARAWAARGDAAKSRHEYDELLRDLEGRGSRICRSLLRARAERAG